MTLPESVKEMINTMERVKATIRRGDDATPFINICSRTLRRLNRALRLTNNVGERNNLQASICRMLGYRTFFKTLEIQGGGRHLLRERIRWHEVQSAFARRVRTGCIVNLSHTDPRTFLDDAKSMTVRRLTNELKKIPFLKVNSIFTGQFTVQQRDELKHIQTRNSVITRDTNLKEWYDQFIKAEILRELEEFQERDSGWALAAVVDLNININHYNPQRVGSYIPLPPAIQKKKACVNVQNTDDACFAWAIVSALYPNVHNSNRIASYPHYRSVLNVKDIAFPIRREDIAKFEQLNNISINVYILDKKLKCVPNRLTKNKKDRHVNLLLIQNRKKCHYVWIKDLSRLISRQLNNNTKKKFFCDRCLHYFHSESRLNIHQQTCGNVNDYKISFPEEKTIQFKNFKNKFKVPFVVYADFECLVKPTNDSKKTHLHVPYSVGYYFKCAYDNTLSYYRSYRGEEPAKWLVRELKNIAENAETAYLCPIPMDKLTCDEYRQEVLPYVTFAKIHWVKKESETIVIYRENTEVLPMYSAIWNEETRRLSP